MSNVIRNLESVLSNTRRHIVSTNGAKLAGQFRHILGIVGAALVAGGYADSGVIQEIIGGLLALSAMVLSWTSPAKKVGEGDLS